MKDATCPLEVKDIAISIIKKYHRGLPIHGEKPKTLKDRILEKTEIKINGCWIWKGAKSGSPSKNIRYGYINIDGKARRVHRVFYELYYNADIKGKTLMHSCDNPSCINPEHIFVGTPQDNMDDMINKGRDRHPRGEANKSKLNEKDIFEIKEMREQGETFVAIAKEFDISATHARNIVNNKKWKHV